MASAEFARGSSSRRIEESIHTESLGLVYDSTPAASAAIAIAVGFLAYLFADSLPRGVFGAWAGYMLAVALGRLLIHRAFLRRNRDRYHPIWARLVILVAALTGIGWGACTLLFFNSLPFEKQEVLILVLVAYSAGALTTMFPVPAAMFSLLVPSVVPLIFLIFSQDGKLPFSIGSMLVVFLIFVSTAAGRLRRLLSDSLQLRFTNEQLNATLLIEVEARKKAADRLMTARREAEQANMAKTQFLANMSHDIRTPMNGIIGMTRLALETELSREQRKYLDTIRISADGLLGLLNDILDFSKIEAGQLLIVERNFNLQELLANIHSSLVYTAREKGLQLVFPENLASLPRFVLGDELRLRQILINLLGNAIKFTHQGSVTLEIEAQQGDGERLVLWFRVKDTGIGIPLDKHDKIFAVFSQADSSMARKYGGSGLGLSISKQLVEMMGGRIWLESEEGQGSTFHFTTIFKPGRQEGIPVADDAAKSVRPLHILVADDNTVNCDLAQLLLKKNGHSVVTVSDGLTALRTLGEKTFDLVLMDVQMPTMDGLTASQIIRKSESRANLAEYSLPPEVAQRLVARCAGQHIPIVAMTANAMEGDRQKCLNSGMDGYLTKPFNHLQINQTIAEFFG